MSVPTPVWSRPDDAVRQAQLDAMKRRATGLLALAAAIFGAAAALEARYPWLGYVRATAEASLVGGLADWFAVTALFRRPLGLPIPHTAIVATRKERIGRILGTFVQSHFLSREVIAAKLRTMSLARRAAVWLSRPENSRRVAQQVAGGIAKTLEALPDDEMRPLVHDVVTARLRTLRVAPTLGKTLSLVLAGDAHQDLLSEAVRLAAQAVHDNQDVIRRQVRAESPWWVPGAVDDKIYEKIVGAIELLLRRIATDPGHPLRVAFDAALRDFIDRLQHSPDAIARTEALKEDWLAEPGPAELSARLWEATRRAVVTYATQASAHAPRPLDHGISTFAAALAANDALLEEIDSLVIDLTVSVVEQYRQEIGDFIAQTVAGWDPQATSRRFEIAVGGGLPFLPLHRAPGGGAGGPTTFTPFHPFLP